jgi:hypothetical protein
MEAPAVQAGASMCFEGMLMSLPNALRTFLAAAALGVAALPLAAQTQAEAEAALAAAFEGVGCIATPETSGDVFAASGLSEQAFMAAGQAMVEDGRIVQTETEARYTAGACAAAAVTAPAADAVLLAAVRDHGCVVTDAEAEAVLGPLGDPEATREAVAALVRGGGAALVRVESALLLSEELCAGGAPGAPFAAARTGAATLIVMQMQRWNCIATRTNVERAFDEMSFDDVDGLLAALAAGGAVEDGGEFIGLTRPVCFAAPHEIRRIVADALGG